MTARARADWFVAHDRVDLYGVVDDLLVLADVTNEAGERRRVEWTPDGWTCTCEHGRARQHPECSHILATRTVVARRPVPTDRPARFEQDEDHDLVLELLDGFIADRQARRAVHRERCTRLASWLGREVGFGRLLASDADRRLESLIRTTWDDLNVPLFVVPIEESRRFVRAAFARGLAAGQTALVKAVA